MNIKHELKVGIFILGSIAILIFVILWLHKFDMSSYLFIDAKFKDVGSLSIGSSVLYRGVKAGTVNNIVLSPDEEYALVKIRITNKDVNVYEGSTASVVDKGFTGTKVLSINPPESSIGKRKLVNGDTINGINAFNFEQMQKLFTELAEEGKLDDMINDTHDLIKTSKRLTLKMDTFFGMTNEYFTDENVKKADKLVLSTTKMAGSLEKTSTRLDKILSNKNLGQDISKSIASTGEAMRNLKSVMDKANNVVDKTNTVMDKTNSLVEESDTVVKNIDKTVNKLDDTINNPETQGSLKNSLTKMSDVLQDIRDVTGDQEVKNNLKGTINQSKNSFSKLNCFSTELSTTLSKRFLIPRLFLGRPGKNLEKCIPQKP